jgi:uncharacterized integral membrane protein
METNKPDRKVFRLISTLILITLILILAYQNSDKQTLTFFFWKTELPLFVALFFAFTTGILLMLLLMYPKYRRTHNAESKVSTLRERIGDLEKELEKVSKQNK